MQTAYDNGAQYMLQLNDDSMLLTEGWSHLLVTALRKHRHGVQTNLLGAPLFGVSGPEDFTYGRPTLLTHSFAHRTHITIHGHWFHPEFRNWFSDNWFSEVYGKNATTILSGVKVRHMVSRQELRYAPDEKAGGDMLAYTLQQGQATMKRFLAFTDTHKQKAGYDAKPGHKAATKARNADPAGEETERLRKNATNYMKKRTAEAFSSE